jgi:transmembrane sensor
MAGYDDANPSEAVKDEAALWVARLRGGDCTLGDERDFRAWLTAGPAHAAAFEAMQATWEIAAALPRDPARFGYKRPRPPIRRELLWGLGAAAITGGAFATWQGAAAMVYKTRIGEQKHITLPDGSLMFLDTDTRAAFSRHDGFRQVRLDRGRVGLRVAPDEDRLFRVEAGRQTVITSHSRLDVSEDGESSSVVLIDGQARVQVSRPQGPETRHLLSGERLHVTSTEVRLDRPNLSALLAWQHGQVIFENNTLKQAAAALNRYSDTKLVIEDSAVASWRISGVFSVGDNFAVVKAVSKFLPLDSIQTSGRILMIRDRSRSKLG